MWGDGRWRFGGRFDRDIFREWSLPAVVDWIRANPVRRGLVELPTDWAWSSARYWEGRDDVPLPMDPPFE